MRYNNVMYNWSHTDPNKLDSQESREIWQLEQAINFGLNDSKLSRSLLLKHWQKLQIDPYKKQALETLLFPNQ